MFRYQLWLTDIVKSHLNKIKANMINPKQIIKGKLFCKRNNLWSKIKKRLKEKKEEVTTTRCVICKEFSSSNKCSEHGGILGLMLINSFHFLKKTFLQPIRLKFSKTVKGNINSHFVLPTATFASVNDALNTVIWLQT